MEKITWQDRRPAIKCLGASLFLIVPCFAQAVTCQVMQMARPRHIPSNTIVIKLGEPPDVQHTLKFLKTLSRNIVHCP